MAVTLAATASSAAAGETALKVVQRLYRDFPPSGARSVADQPAGVLDRYFDPDLVKLIRRDAACTSRTHAICNLDFDPIFASQDPEGARLKVSAGRGGEVSVVVRYPQAGETMRLTYAVRGTRAGRRIHDVRYEKDRTSLRALLSR